MADETEAPSWWKKVTGQGEEDTPEHKFFKKVFGSSAQAAPASPAAAPPSGGELPKETSEAPAPSAPSPTSEGPGSGAVYKSPDDLKKVSEAVAKKSPIKPTLGSELSKGEAAAPSGGVGKALASDKERDNSNSALMSGLLGWGISTLLAPQWSKGASVYGGIHSGIDSYNQYNAQREHETDKDREERLAQAKIGLEGAQAQHHLAAAKTAGQSEKLQLELLKNASKPDKNDPGELIAQAPGLLIRSAAQHAGQGTDLITGKTPVQQIQEAVESAKQLQAANAAQTRAQMRHALQQKLAAGTATYKELETLAPEAITAARTNAKVKENLRKAFSNNPRELELLERAIK